MEIRRVNVGGYELSAHVRKREGIPVVFVSGLGETHQTWKRVLDVLPDSLCTVAYDRAGLGDSDPYPAQHRNDVTYRQAANDLNIMLAGLRILPPWLLVGHSYGGCVVRSFADDRPNDVAGIVLVDPSTAELSMPRDLERHYREEPRDVIYDGDLDHHSKLDAETGAAQLHAERLPQGPAVVLTRARDTWLKPVPPEVDDYWYMRHEKLVDKLNAWHIIALTAGHGIQEEEPALVAKAITLVSRAIAAGRIPEVEATAIQALGGTLRREPKQHGE